MFTKKEINLRKLKWLELLKNDEMSILHHLVKANVGANALRKYSMVSTTHFKEDKEELAK